MWQQLVMVELGYMFRVRLKFTLSIQIWGRWISFCNDNRTMNELGYEPDIYLVACLRHLSQLSHAPNDCSDRLSPLSKMSGRLDVTEKRKRIS